MAGFSGVWAKQGRFENWCARSGTVGIRLKTVCVGHAMNQTYLAIIHQNDSEHALKSYFRNYGTSLRAVLCK